MSDVYVNLMNSDVHEAMERAEAEGSVSRPMPPSTVHAGRSVKDIMAQRRTERLNGKTELQANVVRLPTRRVA